jgi:ring-1,2-phenylacetyl-CoA epoxidase subunit PaaB
MPFKVRTFMYGDIPESGGAQADENQKASSEKDWPLWEVFIRSRQGLDHKHAGSLHAADAKMAIENARDVYTRRMEGVSIWVVESRHIHASNPDESGSLFDPANDKVYRHPTFYDLPDEVRNM